MCADTLYLRPFPVPFFYFISSPDETFASYTASPFFSKTQRSSPPLLCYLNPTYECELRSADMPSFFPKATAKGSFEKSTTIKDCRSDRCLERLSSKATEVTVIKDYLSDGCL